VFAKYTVQALLLYSLNPEFSTGKRYKLNTNFTFCFSLWGTSSPDPYRGFAPEPHWETSVPQTSWPGLPPCEPPSL